jgi:hypothetical protein
MIQFRDKSLAAANTAQVGMVNSPLFTSPWRALQTADNIWAESGSANDI